MNKTKLEQQSEILIPQEECPFYENQRVLSELTVDLKGPIQGPKYYSKVVNRMIDMQEDENVNVIINSVGGNIDGMISMLTAIESCPANVTTYIEGACHSAVSIIALNSPNVAVGKYAHMLIHNASGGFGGKFNEIGNEWDFNKKFLEKIFMESYKYFLTDKEIENVLKGIDIWLDSDQISERLTRRFNAIEKENNKINNPPKPKKIKKESPKDLQLSLDLI